MSRGGGRTARGVAAVLALAGAVPLATGPAAAQEADGEEGPEAPVMAESPRQFRLSVTGSGLSWDDDPALAVDGTALFGLDVERLLTRYASVRVAGSYGATSVTAGDRTASVNTAVAELSLAGRLALPSLRRAGIVPFAGVGVGSIVFDPEPADLTTRSQNAFTYGGGVAARPFARFGFRAEWRHYAAELENLFDATDRTGSDRDGNRFQASVFWTF